jgi:hypothetical protein
MDTNVINMNRDTNGTWAVSTPTQVVQQDFRAVETAHPRRGFIRGEKLPALSDAVQRMRGIIESQSPLDVNDVPLADIRMNPTSGGLYNRTKASPDTTAGLAYTSTGLGQLLTYVDVPRNFKAALEYLTPAARAAAFNDAMTRSAEKKNVTLRTVTAGDKRLIRSTVSDRHSLETGDDLTLLDGLSSILPGDAKARFVRQWDRSFYEVILPQNKLTLRRVGDVFFKLLVTNSETKHGSLEIAGGLFTLVCLNGMTRMTEGTEVSIRHIGNLQSRISRYLRTATLGLEDFARQFDSAFDSALTLPRAEVIERAVKRLELPERVGTSMAALWDADGIHAGGDTLGGLVQSMTRASQQESYETAAHMESQAGRLVNDGLKLLGL